MKYKVGDKVMVRSDLVAYEGYPEGECIFIETMLPFIGKEVTIRGISSSGRRYLIEGNNDRWTDEMLEDVEEEFKLPENGRWCIKAAKENIGILGDYWDKGCGLHEVYSHESTIRNDVGKYWCSYNLSSGNLLFSDSPGSNHTIEEKPNGLLEITFDQFKKYVLKESESIPVKEEVKFEAGKWYEYSAGYIDHRTYAKYSGNQSVSGRFYYDEIITANNGFKKGHNWSVLTCKPVLLTDLLEIQQYLPENHPDKIKKKTKKVEDLRYPDAVHCVSKKEHYKVKQFANIGDYNGNCYYLLDAKSWRKEPWIGTCASNLESRTTYTNYEFSDIIFPEEKTVNKEDEEFKIGAYIVFIDDFGSSKKGDIDKIKTVYSPEQIMLEKEGISWGRLGEGFSKRCKYFLTLEEAQRFSDELLGKNKVETKPMLSKEELLAEAKRRYPVGTVFNAARGERGEYTVGSNSVFRYNSDDAICIKDDGNGTVYYRGEWAEITSKPFNSPITEKEVERLSFYVRYNTSFTEDLYNKLVDWCVKNNIYKTRGWSDTYKGLIENGFFIYDSASLNKQGVYGYGVDNNRQSCINEYSIQRVKELIGYKEVLEHPKYVECIGLEEVNVMFWSQCFTIGEIYLVEEDDETTSFRINGKWCDKSQFKPSTKESFDKQKQRSKRLERPISQKKEELVQTSMSQQEACRNCSYYKIVKGDSKRCYKQDSCYATGGQHYPKDYVPGSRTGGYMDKVPASERLIIHAGNMGLLRGLYNIPVEPKDCFESDEIYVPIIKTEVKQIKL